VGFASVSLEDKEYTSAVTAWTNYRHRDRQLSGEARFDFILVDLAVTMQLARNRSPKIVKNQWRCS